MAKISNAFTTYSSNTNKESLSDVINDISPVEVPIYTMAKKKSISNRSWDWSEEQLRAPAANAQLEGYQNTNSAVSAPNRIGNTTQISKADATVSRTQQSVDMAGVGKNFLANRMAKVAKELKRDIEVLLSSAQPRVNGSDTVARQTRGLEAFITTNVSLGTGGAVAANETTAPTDGTIRTFTQAMLDDALELCYTNGAEPDTLVVGPYTKRKVSHFIGRNGIQVQVPTDKLVVGFSVYQGDLGLLKIVPSRFSRARSALLIDKNYVSVAFLRDFETYELATTGSAQTKVIEAEWGLEVGTERAHGKICDIADVRANDPTPLT